MKLHIKLCIPLYVCFWEDNPYVSPCNNHCYKDKREKGQQQNLGRGDTNVHGWSKNKAGNSKVKNDASFTLFPPLVAVGKNLVDFSLSFNYYLTNCRLIES